MTDHPLQRPASRTDARAVLTVVLINWVRPENMRRILDGLERQTLRPEIFLWNNGEPFSHPAVTWQVQSSDNRMCWPRWFMASMASTEFVAVMDDDLMLADDDVLRDLVERARQTPPRTILGLTGAIFDDMLNYGECRHLWASAEGDQSVDIVKGRFMLMRTADLKAVHLEPSPPREVLMGDDIVVCGAVAEGRRGTHLIPSLFSKRWKELPDQDGLSLQETHWAFREKARRKAFIRR